MAPWRAAADLEFGLRWRASMTGSVKNGHGWCGSYMFRDESFSVSSRRRRCCLRRGTEGPARPVTWLTIAASPGALISRDCFRLSTRHTNGEGAWTHIAPSRTTLGSPVGWRRSRQTGRYPVRRIPECVTSVPTEGASPWGHRGTHTGGSAYLLASRTTGLRGAA